MIHTDGEDWKRWRGTLGDVAAAAQIAIADLTQWQQGGQPGFSMSAEIKPHRTLRSEDAADLHALMDRDPASIENLTVTVGGTWQPPRVEIAIRRSEVSPSLRIEVKGEDETRVHGLTGRLRERLDTGRRWPQIELRPTVILLGVAVVAVAANLAALYVRDRIGLVPVVAAFALVPIMLALWFLLPSLELLRPGQETRWRRYGRYFIGGVGLVASALSIYAVLAAP